MAVYRLYRAISSHDTCRHRELRRISVSLPRAYLRTAARVTRLRSERATHARRARATARTRAMWDRDPSADGHSEGKNASTPDDAEAEQNGEPCPEVAFEGQGPHAEDHHEREDASLDAADARYNVSAPDPRDDVLPCDAVLEQNNGDTATGEVWPAEGYDGRNAVARGLSASHRLEYEFWACVYIYSSLGLC